MRTPSSLRRVEAKPLSTWSAPRRCGRVRQGDSHHPDFDEDHDHLDDDGDGKDDDEGADADADGKDGAAVGEQSTDNL